MDLSTRDWIVFFQNCLDRRIRPEKFDILACKLYARSPVSGRVLAELLIRPRDPDSQLLDPLIPVYLYKLLDRQRIDAADTLRAGFRWSRDRPLVDQETANAKEKERSRWRNSLEMDELIFHRVTRLFVNGDEPKSPRLALEILQILTHWMQSMVSSHHNDSMLGAMTGAVQPIQVQSLVVREALGVLMYAILENERMLGVINNVKLTKGTFQHCPCKGLFTGPLNLYDGC
jgi:mediator of RNA polymerase II transcription subunit 5